jgi:predicted transcriptional regulator
MTETTTIQVKQSTKEALEKMKIYKRETYNDVLERLIEEVQELNEETKKDIELARKAVKEGRFVTHEKLKEEMGF